MITLKRILRYLFYTIKENRGKTIMLLCAIALLYPIYNCNPDLKEKVKVITSFKYGVNTCYVYYSESSFSVLKFDKEQPISSDGYITIDTDNIWLIISWAAFIILCIILIIASIIYDRDTDWGFEDRWDKVLHRDIVCEFEDGYYYYILDNKLLCKSESKKNNLFSEIDDYRMSPNLFIEFETKKNKRNNKLNDILDK